MSGTAVLTDFLKKQPLKKCSLILSDDNSMAWLSRAANTSFLVFCIFCQISPSVRGPQFKVWGALLGARGRFYDPGARKTSKAEPRLPVLANKLTVCPLANARSACVVDERGALLSAVATLVMCNIAEPWTVMGMR